MPSPPRWRLGAARGMAIKQKVLPPTADLGNSVDLVANQHFDGVLCTIFLNLWKTHAPLVKHLSATRRPRLTIWPTP